MIVVVGATGSLGTCVTKELAAAGKPVTALVRDRSSEKARALEAVGARLVVGDLKDAASIEQALRRGSTVICSASSMMSRRAGDSIEMVDQQGVQNLISAAERTAVRRFIFVSSSRNVGEDFPLAAAKRAAEKRLESSRLDYTILLPSYFPETFLSPGTGFDVANGKVRIYGNGTSKVSYIALEDFAKAVVACVDNPAVSRQAIPVGGPQALSQLEIVRLVERTTGRKLHLEYMTAEQIQAARANTTDPLMSSFLGLCASLAKGDEIPTDWTRQLNVQPMSLAEWIAKNVKA